MADLLLHLPFARRLRFAQGLHPLAGEAIGRRPALVALGASLAGLPARERHGMSWFRRIFSGGGEAARWQKLLAARGESPHAGQSHVDVLVSVLRSEDASIGPMARLALGAGMLAHEILEEKVGALTSSLVGPQRAAVERAQGRLWLQTLESKAPLRLENEWRPVLDFADSDANKRTLQHIDRALKRVYGSGPGEGSLGRWLKALATEIGPLADVNARGGSLPPSLTLTDADARTTHFDDVAFVDKTKAATRLFVTYANRLAEAFQKASPAHSAIVEALGNLHGHAPGMAPTHPSDDVGASRLRWQAWLEEVREAALIRGRNPQPAFAEGEYQSPTSGHRLVAVTKVMSLADLPPESDDSGAPPMPDTSGPPSRPRPLRDSIPNVTQEVSLAQIESELGPFASPPMTQEVSLAQIESEGLAALNQEASANAAAAQALAQPSVVAPPADPNEISAPNVTQPMSIADVVAANEEDLRAMATTQVQIAPPPAQTPPPLPPTTEVPRGADDPMPLPPHALAPAALPLGVPARSAEDAAAAVETGTETNGRNGADHAPADPPASGLQPKPRTEPEPPRE